MKPSIKALQNIMLTLVILLINLLPIIYIPFLQIPFELPRFVIIGIIGSLLFICNIAHLLLTNRFQVFSKPIQYFLLIYIFIYAMSTILSISPTISFFGIRQIYTGGFIYLTLLLNIMYTSLILKEEKMLIIKSMIFVAIGVSVVGIYDYITHLLQTKEWFFRVSSTIGQPVKLSNYLLCILPLSFGILLDQKNKLLKFAYFLGFLILFIAFLLTFSRSSFIIFCILTFIFIINTIFISKKNLFSITKKFNFIKNSGTLLLICIIFVFSIITIRNIPFTIQEFNTSSFSIRLNEWKMAISEIKNRSFMRHVIGFGPDTLVIQYDKFESERKLSTFEELTTQPLQIRNYWLNILFTTGIIGFIGYFLLFLYIMKNLYSQNFTSHIEKSIIFTIIGILLHAFFYYLTDNVLLILWILIGLSISHKSKYIFNQSSLLKKMSFGLFLVPFLFFIFFTQLSLAEITISLDNTREGYKKALKINPFENQYRIILAIGHFRNALNIAYNDKNKAEISIKKAISLLNDAYLLSNADYKIHNLLSTMLYWSGLQIHQKYIAQALPWSLQAVKLSPKNYIAWDQLGLIYLNQKQYQNAVFAFTNEIKLNPKSFVPYLHLGETYKQQGNITQAFKMYTKALQLNPGNMIASKELLNLKIK